jgi:hypothetical protein
MKEKQKNKALRENYSDLFFIFVSYLLVPMLLCMLPFGILWIPVFWGQFNLLYFISVASISLLFFVLLLVRVYKASKNYKQQAFEEKEKRHMR